mgnify:CR=1 FL=1
MDEHLLHERFKQTFFISFPIMSMVKALFEGWGKESGMGNWASEWWFVAQSQQIYSVDDDL